MTSGNSFSKSHPKITIAFIILENYKFITLLGLHHPGDSKDDYLIASQFINLLPNPGMFCHKTKASILASCSF